MGLDQSHARVPCKLQASDRYEHYQQLCEAQHVYERVKQFIKLSGSWSCSVDEITLLNEFVPAFHIGFALGHWIILPRFKLQRSLKWKCVDAVPSSLMSLFLFCLHPQSNKRILKVAVKTCNSCLISSYVMRIGYW